jgi:anti-sigma regulatory factor (Ser/Thr protein kinase)
MRVDPTFDHPGLLYRTRDEYRDGTLAFARAALAAGEPLLVAVPSGNLQLIRDGLGRDARRVQFADMTRAGRNPGRIIPKVLLPFANRHPDRRVSIIGEPIWPGRTGLEYPACVTHEALINAAFAGRDAAILCPYDVSGLPARAVADARLTHPVLIEAGIRRPSPAYADPVATAARFNLPLPAPPPSAARLIYRTAEQLAQVRRFVTDRAAAALPADRATAAAAAVNELGANSIVHAGGGGEVAIWTEPTELVCQVSDAGHITDPLAGRLPAPPRQPWGRGLVLVNDICDLVRIHTRPGRTTIRLHLAT